MSPKERLGYAALAAVLLFFAGFVGARHLKPPVPILLQGEPAPATGAEAVVHVSGAVKSPGTVTLAAGERAEDAIAKAGGATSEADLDAVNLAAHLPDGAQLDVPRKGELAPDGQGAGPAPGAPPPGSTAGGLISLSTANAQQLESVPGIGPATSARILEYRAANGGFRSVDELVAIKGIGPKRLEQLRPYLRP